MNWEKLVNELANVKTKSNLFNPYSDYCKLHDKPNAPKIRKRNLELYLRAQIKNKPNSLWVAEAPGYKGMRRTGIPLVSEDLLKIASQKFGTKERFSKATKTQTQKERTANRVWEVIPYLNDPPFLWNAVMFHPHEPGNQMSNRSLKTKEIKLCKDMLEKIIRSFSFDKIIAIGKVAEKVLLGLGIECQYVRHPSHGGSNKFKKGISEIYEIGLEKF